MEQDVAILMADLSGYTALTETHGAASAADVIDKFLEIVQRCLVGDSHLHGRVGDEVLIVSSSPDQLMETAIMLMQTASNEENFLQLHGGLHYGKLLKRNNDYFGSAINLTSRIASSAHSGTFWCSQEFIDALCNKAHLCFEPKGKKTFKNVSRQMEVFELVINNPKSFYIDPVCRMLIYDCKKATCHPHEQNTFFCGPECLQIYLSSQSK